MGPNDKSIRRPRAAFQFQRPGGAIGGDLNAYSTLCAGLAIGPGLNSFQILDARAEEVRSLKILDGHGVVIEPPPLLKQARQAFKRAKGRQPGGDFS